MASSESVLEGKRNLFQLCCIVDSIEPKRTGEGSVSMSSLDGNLGAIKGREILGAMNALGGFAAKKVGQIDPKDITPVVSTPFVVASRRLKKASKSNIPFVTDSLLKLKHMGANAVDKLGNIGMLIDSLPKALGKVTNVGQFKGLIQLANNDKQLRNQLLGLLKLNQTKWEDVSEQVLRCVHKDNRVRVWCPEDIERDGLRVGFLFGCDCGCPDLTIPIGVYSVTGASSLNMTSTLPEARRHIMNLAYKIDPQDLRLMDFIKSVQGLYRQAWKTPGHPDWQIGDMETDRFLTNKDQCMLFRSVSNASGILQHPSMVQYPSCGFPSGNLTSDSEHIPKSAFAFLQPPGSNNDLPGKIDPRGLPNLLPMTTGHMFPEAGDASLRSPSFGPAFSGELGKMLIGALQDDQIPSMDALLGLGCLDGGKGFVNPNNGNGTDAVNTANIAKNAKRSNSEPVNSTSHPSSGVGEALASILNNPMWNSDELDNSLARQLSIDHMLNGSNSFPIPSFTPTSGGTLDALAAQLSDAAASRKGLDTRIPSVNQALKKKIEKRGRQNKGLAGKPNEPDLGKDTTTETAMEKNIAACAENGNNWVGATVEPSEASKKIRSLELQERIDSTKVMAPPKRRKQKHTVNVQDASPFLGLEGPSQIDD